MIELSTFDPAAAFIAVDRHELDDFKTYIYKTEDFGKTWRPIATGLPKNTFVRVVREDPKRKGLLYAGTETGVFVSFNDGAVWQPLQLNLPVTPIHDLVVKDDDLVAATHGRSFWILDDLTPLHQLDEKAAAASSFLFRPRDTIRTGGWSFPIPNVGKNPPSGTLIYYYFKEKPKSEVVLEFMDSNGARLRSYSSLAKPEVQPDDEFGGMFGGADNRALPAEAGMNRFVWDMRYPDAEKVPGAILWGGSVSGPLAPPGIYQVKLTVGDVSHIREWEWKKDPRSEASPEELRDQFDFLIQVRDKLSEVNRAVNTLRKVRDKIDRLAEEVKARPEAAAFLEEPKKASGRLTAVEDVLIQAKSKSSQDPLNYPVKLDDKIAALAAAASGADAPPTDQVRELFKELSEKAEAEIRNLKAVLESDVPRLNDLLREAGVPHLVIE